MYSLFVLYVLASLFVGYLGKDRLIGFLGFFVLSLLVTPVVSSIVLFLGLRRPGSA
jgi:hypothetical protein